MSLAIILVLLSLCAWLAVKLGAASRDNADLKVRIESLKRQLVRLR